MENETKIYTVYFKCKCAKDSVFSYGIRKPGDKAKITCFRCGTPRHKLEEVYFPVEHIYAGIIE